jgi:hypothetical protein
VLTVGPLTTGADRAEPLALGPHGVRPAPQQRLDLVGSGGRRQVAVVRRIGDAEQQVTDRTADEVQPVPGGGEALGERRQLVEDRGEASGDHGPREARRRPSRGHAAGV